MQPLIVAPAKRTAPLAFLVLLLPFSRADESIVLPPTRANGSLPGKMLVFIPGGAVPNEKYVFTARAIQETVTQLNLWVVIPAVFRRLCIIACATVSLCAPLHATVTSVLAMAEAQGWKGGKHSEDVWLGGHSLGGVCANTLFQAYTSGSGSPYAGIVLFGSYVDESGAHDLVHYPKPVLTLNAELDGLTRPGKTAVWWRQYLDLQAAQGEAYALMHKPVIILPQMNHSDFCPGFDVPGDLLAEVGQAEATAAVGRVVGAFFDAQVSGLAAPARSSALDFLKEKVTWTRNFLAPYLRAQEMERLAADTRVSSEGASPFCAAAQHVIAGLSEEDDKRLAVSDGFHVTPADVVHCHPTWIVASDGLSVHSCSHTDYYADFDNTGGITAARQVACKMITSARVAQQLNSTSARPQADCREVNKYAVRLAEALAAPSTLERYRRSGRGWCFLDDEPVAGNIGPIWVFDSSLKLEANATCMAVASPSLKTELDEPIYPGSHYCKLLSPARALDWMMSDSLKPALSVRLKEVKHTEMWV